jgi:hypothetical protein
MLPQRFFLLAILTLHLCVWASCTGKKTAAIPSKKINIVVLLDLSDRVLDKNQVTRDKALLQNIFSEFQAVTCRKNFVNSYDQLQVLVLPQKNAPAGVSDFEQRLQFNLAPLEVKAKSTYLKNKAALFTAVVDSLYQLVTDKRIPQDFAGADTWQFFDQLLPHYLVTDTQTLNKVIVITDGYFDFENNEHKKENGCQYSYSAPVMQKARQLGTNWQKAFEKGCGLIPVTLNQPNTSLLVLEKQHRNNFTYEKDLLQYLWTNWLAQMKIGRYSVHAKTSPEDAAALVKEFIEK